MTLEKKAVIFDLDGVICFTDKFHYQAWKALADRLGIYFDEKINDRLRGVSRMASLDIILERADKEYTQEEKEAFATEKNDTYRELLKNMSPADLTDEVKNTLVELRNRGYKLSIGSSSKNTKFILGQIGLGNFFDAIADGTDITHSKPDPEVFLISAKKIGIDPADCAVVEDANDVNAATLGELWKGGAQGHHSAFLVTLGTGIGGGLVVNDEIINGVNGGAGEIGHFCVEPSETERCKCGGHGCLEQYCSATGLLRQAKKALAENRDTVSLMKNNPDLTAKDVCDAAKRGDTLALDLLDGLGHRLGWALTAVAGTADPEVFVIGGGLSNAGEILLDKIEFYYRKYAFHAFRNTPFVLAKLGNDAGIYGCARMIL